MFENVSLFGDDDSGDGRQDRDDGLASGFGTTASDDATRDRDGSGLTDSRSGVDVSFGADRSQDEVESTRSEGGLDSDFDLGVGFGESGGDSSGSSGDFSDRDRERVEQSFGLESGRYRRSNGRYAEGSPPNDYNQDAERFQGEDGRFKSRSADLGADTQWDGPDEDSENTFTGGLFDY